MQEKTGFQRVAVLPHAGEAQRPRQNAACLAVADNEEAATPGPTFDLRRRAMRIEARERMNRSGNPVTPRRTHRTGKPTKQGA